MTMVTDYLIKHQIRYHPNQGITVCTVSDQTAGLDLAKELLNEIVDKNTVLYLSGGFVLYFYRQFLLRSSFARSQACSLVRNGTNRYTLIRVVAYLMFNKDSRLPLSLLLPVSCRLRNKCRFNSWCGYSGNSFRRWSCTTNTAVDCISKSHTKAHNSYYHLLTDNK